MTYQYWQSILPAAWKQDTLQALVFRAFMYVLTTNLSKTNILKVFSEKFIISELGNRKNQ